jgi:hypothetical protein
MIENIFKISFDKYISEDIKMSEDDKDRIANLGVISSFDYETDKLYICHIISTDKEMKKYLTILEKYGIEYECLNLSLNILNSEYNLAHLKQFLYSGNKRIYKVFMKDFNNWYYSNLDLDFLLDKINSKGINSLTKIDKKFLKENC